MKIKASVVAMGFLALASSSVFAEAINNTVTVTTTGTYNNALVDQKDTNGDNVAISQQGGLIAAGNRASVTESSSRDNKVVINQSSVLNNASVNTSGGAGNATNIDQSGVLTAAKASVVQTGEVQNKINITQTGFVSGSTANVNSNNGTGNTTSIYQTGVNSASVAQNVGSDNTTIISQTGALGVASVGQASSSGNNTNVQQDGASGNATVSDARLRQRHEHRAAWLAGDGNGLATRRARQHDADSANRSEQHGKRRTDFVGGQPDFHLADRLE